MLSTKYFRALSLALVFLCSSCGFDKLHPDIIADFYLKNETGSPVIFKMRYYARETSLLPKDVSLSIDNKECIALFKGLVFIKGYSDEEILLFSLSGDIREDTYAEIKIIEEDKTIMWRPSDGADSSIYLLSNWTLEDTFNSNSTTNYKSFIFIINEESLLSGESLP